MHNQETLNQMQFHNKKFNVTENFMKKYGFTDNKSNK